jgi:hypothetical protein
MKYKQLLERITVDPKVMVGKPVICGTRLTVEYILNLLAHGATIGEILAAASPLPRHGRRMEVGLHLSAIVKAAPYAEPILDEKTV